MSKNTITEGSQLIHVDIYRGIWASNLQNNQELPVGGSIFDTKLTSLLQLDFDAFRGSLSPEEWDKIYIERSAAFLEWLKNTPKSVQEHIDPKDYFIVHNLQQAVQSRFDYQNITPQTLEGRKTKYSKKTIPKLSDFKDDGTAACAEIAALGQYFLQNSGIPSAYMSGVWIKQRHGEEDFFGEDHSFLVLYPGTEKELILDIARPLQKGTYPSLYKPKDRFDVSAFEGKSNYLIGTTNLLSGDEGQYFGVSENIQFANEEFRPNLINKKVLDILE